MTRRPLRPLARIIDARGRGENPDAIERENIRARHEAMRETSRARAEGRLLVLGLMFFLGFCIVGIRMGSLASAEVTEPRATATTASILSGRADIVDRKGRILATNIATHSLYAQPPRMIDRERAARELAKIFPDLDEERLVKDFTGKRKFVWVRRTLSPEQMQDVHDIGEPGLQFGPRELRLYPNGRLASHVLGGATFGREGVHSAEVIGEAGVERSFDDILRNPAGGGAPLELSIDLSVQAAVEQVLSGGMRLLNARAAAAVLMDVQTGEILSMASYPDFDPNKRPSSKVVEDPADNPLFNRAVQGVYELGSTFKPFTAAQAIEAGRVAPGTMIDTKGPLVWGRHRIRDYRNYGPELSVTDVIVKSSNIGTARMAVDIGGPAQQIFLKRLGLLEPTEVELVEAGSGRPLMPRRWSEISTMTISYGHGLSTSPLHLAAGYATLVNGGTQIKPTLLKQEGIQLGERIVSVRTSQAIRTMLRETVKRGTATMADVEGYAVGGKTGTADKPDRKNGGYHDDKVIANFASVFPSDDPRYVLVVMLDEPVETSGLEPRRTGGWTAVPISAEITRRVAPLLGLRPDIEPGSGIEVSLNNN
ncbi:MAG: penicillin-binding protein 2 [Pseudomonadota bacterium]